MSIEVVQQTSAVITSNAATIPAASAVQISGAPPGVVATQFSPLRYLTAVSATFIPNPCRAYLRLTNQSASSMWIGSNNTVTASAGYNTVIPAGSTYLMNCRGTMQVWAYSTGGGNLLVEELV